jgi:BirA family biotin operon repressor/biotin-[acetyl-CoA-carboxylase] ligase
LGTVDSTNRYLADLARAGGAEGMVVVADHQTAGRGRLGRSWQARPGTALLVSILLRPDGLSPPGGPDRRHLVTAAVALAAADACRTVAGVTPAVKWPNDLLLGDRKLAGILAVAEGDAIVAGIGLNVSWAPPGGASLLEPPTIRGRLLAELLAGLESSYGHWDEVAVEYRRRCATVGRRVRVELGGRTVVGLAEGIDDCGRLHVSPGPLVLSAADVVHLRRED